MVFFIRYIDACALFQHFDNLIILKYRMIFICYHNTRYIIKVSLFYIGVYVNRKFGQPLIEN